MKVIIDRIEKGFFVIELPNGSIGKMSLNILPEAKEGDVINIKQLKKDTSDKKASFKKLMNDVFK